MNATIVSALRRLMPLTAVWLMRRQLVRLGKCGQLFLDAGCGDGKGLSQLGTGLGLRVIGIDAFEPYLIRAQQSRLFKGLVRGDVRFLPFKSGAFDVAISMEVIEHMTKEEGIAFLSELERVAKRAVVLTTPVGFLPRGEREGNVFQVHKSGWMPHEFRKLGYEVVATTFRYPVSVENEGLATIAFRYVLSVLLYPAMLLRPDLAGGMVCIKRANLEPL